MRALRNFVYVLLATLLASGASAGPAVPGESTADAALATDVTRFIVTYDKASVPGCDQRKIVDTKVLELWPNRHPRLERWTLDRCGTAIDYLVLFSPNGEGGTNFAVRPES